MEGVTHKRGIVELQLCVQRLRKIRAHPLSGLSELHNFSSKRYALQSLEHLVEGVTHNRGFLDVQFVVQRARKLL